MNRIEISVPMAAGLAAATLAATAVVFALGIYVGKGIAERRVEGRSVVRVPVDRGERADEGREVSETFWTRLDGEAIETAKEPRAVETPTPTVIEVPPPAGAPAAVATAEPKPASTPETTPTAEPIPVGGSYQVQIVALGDRRAAHDLVGKLRAEGREVYLVEGVQGGRPLYRVRVGRFDGRVEAEAAVEKLKREGYPGAFLVVSE